MRLAKDTATWDSYELATPDGMMSYLRRSESTTASALALLTVRLGSRTRSDDHAVTVEIGWRPVTPVMARASLDGFAIDALPLVSAHEDGGVALVLPGSSIKGSLRSCAERLLRTLPAFHDEPLAGSGDDSRQRFLAQLDQHELITELFGRGGQRLDNGATGESGGDRPLQGRGLLWVDDCYSTTVIGRDTWDELVSSNEAPRQADHAELTPALRQTLRDKGLIETHHVAIDRWTGGAAKGRLYQVLEPQGVQWEPIRLGVDLWRLDGSGGQDLVLGLLLCVLRELRAGRVPLGYGTNRGMGSVAVESLALREGDIERSISVSGTSDKNPWLDKIASAWGDYANGSGA